MAELGNALDGRWYVYLSKPREGAHKSDGLHRCHVSQTHSAYAGTSDTSIQKLLTLFSEKESESESLRAIGRDI